MKKIALSGKNGVGKFALVDDEDFEYLKQFKWHFIGRYVTRSIWMKEKKENTRISMHNDILKIIGVDHINGNTLDNQKHNLRKASTAENSRNRAKVANRLSKYKGVTRHSSGKWQVYAQRTYGGLFTNETEAAKKYNELALKLFGKFAKLNQL